MKRREEVLATLRASDGALVSGETIAAGLGVSRAAVAKHVASLRASGFEIEANAGEGYRLVAVPEAPVPEEVAAHVASRFWVRFEGGGITGSTNDDCKRLAVAGAPEGTVVLASAQTGGRGRLGRSWASPEGGTYLSALLRPPVGPMDAAPIALVVALGIAQGFESLGVRPRLKWPNDVLLGDGKLAGVLLEMSAESDRVDWVVAGCGVNVRPPEAGASVEGAAYLVKAVEVPVTPARAASLALDGIADAYGVFVESGFGALGAEYEARSALTGRAVVVHDAEGRELASGDVSGVDDSGRLLVGTAGGPVAIAAGEVTLG